MTENLWVAVAYILTKMFNSIIAVFIGRQRGEGIFEVSCPPEISTACSQMEFYVYCISMDHVNSNRTIRHLTFDNVSHSAQPRQKKST